MRKVIYPTQKKGLPYTSMASIRPQQPLLFTWLPVPWNDWSIDVNAFIERYFHEIRILILNPGNLTFARNWEGRLVHAYSYIFLHLNSQNLIENDHNLVFLAVKYQLSNTLKHICFEKMPRNWDSAQKLNALFESSGAKTPPRWDRSDVVGNEVGKSSTLAKAAATGLWTLNMFNRILIFPG